MWLRVLKVLSIEIGPPIVVAGICSSYSTLGFWGPFFGVAFFWSRLLAVRHKEGQADNFQTIIGLLQSNDNNLRKLLGKEPKPLKADERAPPPAKEHNLQRGMYFVDFRARSAASYGHAFVVYGRLDRKQVEVAGLHPATDSVVPYILGHVVPVPCETGASYGDLDEQYLTASHRVHLDEAQAARVFAYIKLLQSRALFWHAPTYNCVSFIKDIARLIGLRVPGNHLLYPKKWVLQLRALNGGGQ